MAVIIYLGVYGLLELHGVDVGLQWSKLNHTANVGDTGIVIAEPVTWGVGAEIVIATTT